MQEAPPVPSRSFWLGVSDGAPGIDEGPLPAQADVVVVGGGFTGISTAYWLSRAGLSVTLIERRDLSGGATGRNGGHLNPGTALDFSDAVRKYGFEDAVGVWEFTRRSVELTRDFIRGNAVECDLQGHGSVSLAMDAGQAEVLRENQRALARAGYALDLWDGEECARRMRSPSFVTGLHAREGCKLWPAKLVWALARDVLGRGVGIHTRTAVLEVRERDGDVSVRTDKGDTKARALVYATNAYTAELLPELAGFIVPVRGQAILTEPAPRLWDFNFLCNEGYEYVVQRQDGRIVLGGMRHKAHGREWNVSDDSRIDPAVSEGLRAFLPRHFPDLARVGVEMEWTGIMGFSHDANPLVGRLPGSRNRFVAAGYTGHGMCMAFAAGKALAEMIEGREPGIYARAFDPGRFRNGIPER